ncbi:MAG: nicotinate-nucleotide adenylyltransferase [Candidatus Hydrogenedentes bacterium]|nr:nicotinate-nucleotide adenylyltransferase [Candidatus Hydrogenedentota bacterium]
MSDPCRIGVFGGTFDPIHNTHLAIARAARQQADLDIVLFVVSAQPPHKHGATFATAEDRLALVEAAVADVPGMRASRIELDRVGPSYTADTLETLHREYPQTELFLIIGMDSLIDLPKWRTPDRILARAHLLVVPRPGDAEIPALVQGRHTMLDFPKSDVSSTDIRARIESGDPCADVLPPSVAALIQQRGLYRECAEHSTRG